MISASNNHKISPIKFPKALIRVVAIFLESLNPMVVIYSYSQLLIKKVNYLIGSNL